MKQYKTIIILILFIISVNKLNAENSMHFGFFGGLAIPNDKVSQFFNDTKQHVKVDSVDTLGNYFLDKAANIGYHLKIQGRIELANNFTFVSTVGISRFNEGRYDLIVPLGNNDTVLAITQSTTNIVPISVGINAYLFKKFLLPYINADLVYNYVSYSYDIVMKENIYYPITKSPTTMHRLGYSVGVGIDIDLYLISLNIETKFNAVNIIKYDDKEPTKSYFTFLVGIVF